MNKIKRFKRYQGLKKNIDETMLHLVPDESLIKNHLQSSIDYKLLNGIENQFDNFYKFEFDLDVSDEDVRELLFIFEKHFDMQKFNLLLAECKYTVIQSIVIPFGLGGVVANLDKDGGNVDTIHNVRQKVWATKKEKKRYKGKGEYNSADYHGDRRYRERNRADSKKQNKGLLRDGYTGKKLGKDAKRDLDHIISASEIHNDRGRVLAEIGGPEVANVKSNFTSTNRSINRAKGARTVDEFYDGLKSPKKERQKLESKSKLSSRERKKLRKLKALESIDPDKLKEKDKKARSEYNKTLSKKYYTSKKFIKNTAVTSAKEGAKIGVHQAIGLLLSEFFEAVFDEISDIYNKGFSIDDTEFIETLKIRLRKISRRIASRWQDACTAFAQGFVSGFLSNLVTVIINTFIRTGKRIIRIIREGFFSLLRAIKLLCLPPEGMTLAQAAHEASKIIASGLIIIGGIAIEESLDKWIKGTAILEPLSDIITNILVGALTGISITFVVYAIDKFDFFKANNKEKHSHIINGLESKLNSMFTESDRLIEKLAWEKNQFG